MANVRIVDNAAACPYASLFTQLKIADIDEEMLGASILGDED